MFRVAVFILATVHFGLGFLVTLYAGLSNNSFLLALAKVLIFPTEQFPSWIQDNAWLGFLAYALSCLVISLVICGVVRLVADLAGLKIAIAFASFLPLLLLGITFSLANPPPDWNSAGHRYLKDQYFFLPHPIKESAEELSHDYAIHQNLHPDEPYQPNPTGRWYWNYRSTSSGFPEYDAVVIASPVRTIPTREEFLVEVENQRAQGWRSSAWQKVEETEHWIVETALPRQDPLTAHEKNRLLRVVAKEPAGGVWIALVALERKMARDVAAGIVKRAMDSVKPMSGPKEENQGAVPQSEEPVSDLHFDISETGMAAIRPAWIQPVIWESYPARRQVHVSGLSGSLQAMALLSDDSAHLHVFLHNAGPKKQNVRVRSPEGRWMFTARGLFVRRPGRDEPTWTLTPSMPISLPKDFELEANELQLIQLAELSPQPDLSKSELL